MSYHPMKISPLSKRHSELTPFQQPFHVSPFLFCRFFAGMTARGCERSGFGVLPFTQVSNHAVPIPHRLDVLLPSEDCFVRRVGWASTQNDWLDFKDFFAGTVLDTVSAYVVRASHCSRLEEFLQECFEV
jgi:hypothetical protein